MTINREQFKLLSALDKYRANTQQNPRQGNPRQQNPIQGNPRQGNPRQQPFGQRPPMQAGNSSSPAPTGSAWNFNPMSGNQNDSVYGDDDDGCPEGEVWFEQFQMCVPQEMIDGQEAVEEDCDPGFVWDSYLNQCVWDQTEGTGNDWGGWGFPNDGWGGGQSSSTEYGQAGIWGSNYESWKDWHENTGGGAWEILKMILGQ